MNAGRDVSLTATGAYVQFILRQIAWRTTLLALHLSLPSYHPTFASSFLQDHLLMSHLASSSLHLPPCQNICHSSGVMPPVLLLLLLLFQSPHSSTSWMLVSLHHPRWVCSQGQQASRWVSKRDKVCPSEHLRSWFVCFLKMWKQIFNQEKHEMLIFLLSLVPLVFPLVQHWM